MGLKNIFKMTKTDRYTQDGRDELAKLQETEDVKYKTGDISQKTGLQKQPDGSWAPPKGSSAAKHQKAMEGAKKVGIVNKVPAGWKKAEGVTTTPNGYVAITNGGSRFPKEGQAKRDVKFIKQEDFEKSASTKPTTEELNTLKDIMREYRKNPNKQTEQIMNEAKSHLMKNRGMTPEQLGKLGREVMAETNQTKAKFDEYGLPDNETISMKDEFLKKEKVADPSKLSNAEFNALAKKLDSELGIGNMERAQELLVTPREEQTGVRTDILPSGISMDDFSDKQLKEYADGLKEALTTQKERFTEETRSGTVKELKAVEKELSRRSQNSTAYKEWANRSKGERTATLVDWLDDWDKHPEEKNDAAYAAIEKELASRGVNRAGRQDAKKADNAGRNEFYRRAYEGDAAPRQLTGDIRIRVKK